jgi:hypothetical protein
MRYERGIANWAADVVVGDFVWPPQLVEPYLGGTVVDDHFEWELPRGDNFHFSDIVITRGGPWWTLILPASQTTLDLVTLPPEFASETSEAQFDVWHYRVLPGFAYDRWSYEHLYRDYTVAIAANAWLVSF